jgi:hypothetical protein
MKTRLQQYALREHVVISRGIGAFPANPVFAAQIRKE